MRFEPATSAPLIHARRTWLVVHAKGIVTRRGGEGLVFLTDEEVITLGGSVDLAHRLGTLYESGIETEGASDALVVAVDGFIDAPFEIMGLRMLAGLLDPALFGIVARAMHAADWLTTSRFCGRCGAATKRSESERCAVCPSCTLRTYPRISPAIITLVRKGDLALLASNAKFPGAFYSTLAGFADIGESLEETLIREVREEVGIDVDDVRYFGSQPWPFPNSLMIGFTAKWAAGDIVIDPSELSDAKWFRADELPMIPPPLSIARKLIDAWVAEVTQGNGTPQ